MADKESLIKEMADAFKAAYEPPLNSFTADELLSKTHAPREMIIQFLDIQVGMGNLSKVVIFGINYYYRNP